MPGKYRKAFGLILTTVFGWAHHTIKFAAYMCSRIDHAVRLTA